MCKRKSTTVTVTQQPAAAPAAAPAASVQTVTSTEQTNEESELQQLKKRAKGKKKLTIDVKGTGVAGGNGLNV